MKPIRRLRRTGEDNIKVELKETMSKFAINKLRK
jgi:hypothetical protein